MTTAFDPDQDWRNLPKWEAEQEARIAEDRAAKAATNGKRSVGRYELSFDDKGKLKLPGPPNGTDPVACAGWLTVAFNLDQTRPISDGVREGNRGPDGHVVLHRVDAPAIRFEPASRLNRAAALTECLTWQLVPTDGPTLAYSNEHARRIADVARYLCGASATIDASQETGAIVEMFLNGAVRIEGHTVHGNGSQRYEAGKALQREVDERTGRSVGPPRYLVDTATGEFVVRVQDLSDAARRYVGGSLARGWLDARMQGLEWERVTLDGHAESGRAGRRGPHVRSHVYRGFLPTSEPTNDGPAVTK